MDESQVNFVAGGVAGVVVDFALYPLDFIKTRIQARNDVIKKPPKSLYSGVLIAMLGSFPSAATFFATYENTKNATKQLSWVPSSISYIAAATLGQISCSIIRVPFEVVKQQMQVGAHQSLRGAVRDISKTHGASGFYTGYISTVARELPFDAVQFALWEHFKTLCRGGGYDEDSKHWPTVSAAAGSVAGGIASIVTTPLDVAKTRLMTQSTDKHYVGMLHVLRDIHKHEGASKLFSGVGVRCIYITSGGFIFFTLLNSQKDN